MAALIDLLNRKKADEENEIYAISTFAHYRSDYHYDIVDCWRNQYIEI